MAGATVWTHPAPEIKGGATLLARIGGVEKVHDFIYGFYDRLLLESDVASVLLRSQQAQKQEIYMKLLKDRSVEYLEIVWGNDDYEGQDMFKAHAHLHISTPIYDKSMKCAAAELKKMGVPSDVYKDAMDQLEVLREPITDADGKFHRWVEAQQKEMEEKLLAEGAVDLHGMGFTSSPKMIKDMADKAKRREDIKNKLAAAKAEREAKEKQARQATKTKQKENQSKPAQSSSETKVKGVATETKGKMSNDAKASSPKAKPRAKEAKGKGSSQGVPPLQKCDTDDQRRRASLPTAEDDESWPVLPHEDDFAFVHESLVTPLPQKFS